MQFNTEPQNLVKFSFKRLYVLFIWEAQLYQTLLSVFLPISTDDSNSVLNQNRSLV